LGHNISSGHLGRTMSQNSPGLRVRVFDSAQFPRYLRLQKFEQKVRAGPNQLMRETYLSPLSSDNENHNTLERLVAPGAYLSFLKSSGFVSAFDKRKLDGRSGTVTVGLLKHGNAEIKTENNSFTIGAGDIYINATDNFQLTFGDTEIVRMIFPAGSQKEIFRRCGEFLVIKNHEPVSQLLKSTLSGLESALRAESSAVESSMSRIATGLVRSLIKDNVSSTSISGYDIIRERAREYIHDNLRLQISPFLQFLLMLAHRAQPCIGPLKGWAVFANTSHLFGWNRPS